MKLWRSGIFWSVLGFIANLGNFAFSAMIGHRMPAEYADTSSLLSFIIFLGLPMTMVGTSLVHYIAHFRGHSDEARLQGLLAGCQSFLLKMTIAGSVLVLVLAEPLGSFFHFRTSLMLTALICVLVGLWSGFASALCQGMGWFKRLAVIGLVAVILRMLFGWIGTMFIPKAEVAVSATTFSYLAYLSLLYWWKDIFRHGAARISPWNKEFVGFLLVTAFYVAGNFFFLSGDALVAKRYFAPDDNKAYQAAGTLARAIPAAVTPLLLVLFSSRSGKKQGQAVSDHGILLGLFVAGLICGACGLIAFRGLWVRIILKGPSAAAAQMIIPLSITMVFAGLSQAIGIWSLASRWLKLAVLYGITGLAYWLALLFLGRTPTMLLHTMPFGTATTFCILVIGWLATSRSQAPGKMAA